MRFNKKNQNLIGILLIISVILIFIILISVYAYARFTPASISQYNVYIVDVTSKLSPQQKGELINHFEKYINESPKNSWHELYIVDLVEDELLKPLLTLKSTFTLSESKNYLTSNPAKHKEFWLKNFVEPFKLHIEKTFNALGSSKSPILESIQSTAITCLNKPEAVNTPRRIILVSDLMQNTEGMNFYQGIPPFENLIQNEYYRKTRTNLKGVSFEIWKLNDNLSQKDRNKLIELWSKIIDDQRAVMQPIITISG
jgi:hypothetical protein